MKRWKIVLLVAVVLIIGASYGFVSLRESPTEAPSGDEVSRTRFTKPHFVGYHEGEREWSLRADQIEEAGPDQPGVLLLDGISEGILYRNGQEDLAFRADHGVWHQRTGVLELEGRVVFWDKDTELLLSERVVWNSQNERLTSPVRATVNYQGQHASADHLVVDLAAERVELRGDVLWTNEDGILVRAETATYTSEELAFTGILEPIRFSPTSKEELAHGT